MIPARITTTTNQALIDRVEAIKARHTQLVGEGFVVLPRQQEGRR